MADLVTIFGRIAHVDQGLRQVPAKIQSFGVDQPPAPITHVSDLAVVVCVFATIVFIAGLTYGTKKFWGMMF